MEQKSLAYAKYWRLCLADADLGIGALNRSDLEKLILRPGSELQHGRVDPELTQEFFKNSGQVAAITQACADRGIRIGKDDGEMTVGTVHSLQGAERPLVIFSPTYSQDADGGFMDRSRSMLNVGVSRAKDNFLVFGDMSIFNPADKGAPRGLLASFLFANENNAISFDV